MGKIVKTAARVAGGIFTLGLSELPGLMSRDKAPGPQSPQDVRLTQQEEEDARNEAADRERRRRARLTRQFTAPGALVPQGQVGRPRLFGN